jgi:hypothetical protein
MERLEKLISDLSKPEFLFSKLSIEEIETHLNATKEMCNCASLPEGNFFYITSNSKNMFLLRKNSHGVIEDIADYGPIHLNNAIIRDIAIRSPGTAVTQTNFILYYHWFYRYYKTYKDSAELAEYINRNLCLSLEDIISIIIQKEETAYKDFDTAAIIQAYRFLVNKIRCIGTIKNINLRR